MSHYRNTYSTTRHIPMTHAVNTFSPPPFPVTHMSHVPINQPLQMHQMSDDMNDMYRQMHQQISTNIGGGDTWLNEDLRMDNPIETDQAGNKKFKLHFDLHQFKPEEIRIVTKDRNLTVSAKHEETKEGRSVNREYSRSYTLPENVDPEMLSSKFTADGILNIEAPLPELKKEHKIAIEHHK